MMDPHSLAVLEFEAVREMLASEALSPPGKELAHRLLPSTHLPEIRQSLEETEEMRNMIASAGEPPLAGLVDLRPLLDRSLLEGAILSASELKEVGRVLSLAGQLRSYFRPFSSIFPLLKGYFSSILPQPPLEERIARSLGDEGEILDSASARLRKLRQDALVLREKIREKLQGLLFSPAYQKVIAEPLITLRNDRYVIPVKPNFKSALKGFIQDQSASGQTLFVEPLSSVDDNNRLKRLRLEEEEEIRRVLADLTRELKEKAHEIRPGVEAMIRLDLLFAKAALARRMKAKRPVMREDGCVRLLQARHPLLIKKAECKRQGSGEKEEVVPIDILLGDPYRILVITGPNMGGKTVALKTLGLLTLMAMAGLHIPASADSEISFFPQIFADIGEEQDIEQSLSTFSSHISQMAKILREAHDRSLVLLDELGSGTDPQEGSALGIAILDELYRRGGIAIATTHQDAIKAHAYSHPGMKNACVEFDLDTLKPLYRLNIGIPGRSYALDIAQQLGIGPEIVASARRLLKSEIIAWDSMLRRIQEDQLAIEQNRAKVEEEAKRASLLREQYERLLREANELRKVIEQEGSRKIESLLAQARRQVEAVVRELRAKDASRESIKEGQQVLASLTQDLARARIEVLEGERRKDTAARQSISWAQGQKVWVRGLRQKGLVMEDADCQGMVEVQIKMGRLRVPSSELEPVSAANEFPCSPVLHYEKEPGEENEIQAELNLIGKRREEAIFAAERYLDQVALAGMRQVRLIHGKGTGILRKGIEEMLRKHPLVEDFQLASFDQGGAGATIVRMKP